MSAKIKSFSGVAPALTKWKLPPGMAQVALNTNLDSRTIKPWRDSIVVLAGVTAAAVTTIFRFGRSLVSDVVYWFTWNKDVDVAKGSVIGDTTERTFYTGDGEPRWTNATLATTGGSPPYPIDYRVLGVPRPLTAPTVTVTGTALSNDYQEVGYAYTHTTQYGEESAPSPISVPKKVYSGQIASISGMEPALGGKQSTVARRIYRSVTSSTDTNLYFIKEVAVVGGPFIDDVGDDIGEVISTDGWIPPPGDGFGLCAMANGIMLIMSGSDVYPSAQYAPYAYPLAYRMSCDFPIVGSASLGVSAIIFTLGNPYLCTGSTPDALKLRKIETPEACVSKRSIANLSAPMPSMGQSNEQQGTCYYASQNGLCSVDSNGNVRVLTEGLLNRDDWQALVPSSIQGYVYNGKYFGFFNTGSVTGGFCFDARGGDAAFSLFPFNATGGFFDLALDHMHLQVGTNIVLWDASSNYLTATWRSGMFQTQQMSWAFVRVLAASYPGAGFITLKLYGDGILIHTEDVLDDSMFRVPGDDHYKHWEIEIITKVEVYEVAMAVNGADAKKWALT